VATLWARSYRRDQSGGCRLGLGLGAGSNKTYGLAKDGVGVSSGGVDEFDEPPKKSTEKKKKKKKKAEEGGDDWMRTTNIMQVHDHGASEQPAAGWHCRLYSVPCLAGVSNSHMTQEGRVLPIHSQWSRVSSGSGVW
jgi:hypothetical protein